MGVSTGVTLADISREAGVSVTTVSKVLTGKAGPFGISKQTQDKIWRVARQLNYAPDLHARSLRRGRSNQIGIVVAHFNDPWYGQVIHGLESSLERNNFGFLINSVEEEPAKLTLRINHMRSNRVEGLVIAGSRLELPQQLAELLREIGMPVMLINRKSQWPWISSIMFDHVHSGLIATKHLLELGHRRIGMLLGPQTDPGNDSRVAGYRIAVSGAGLPSDEDGFEYAEPLGGFDSWRNGYEAIQRLLRRRPDLTAVVAFDDSVAIGAMRGAHEIGRRIPDQLSITGVDDSSPAEFATPPLTTVQLPTGRVGEVAGDKLVEMLSTQKMPPEVLSLEFKGTLVVRQSTAPPPQS